MIPSLALLLNHLAVLENDLETLRALSQHQPEGVYVLCGQGKTPFDYIYKHGHIDAIGL